MNEKSIREKTREEVESFFRKDDFSQSETKKIIKLANKHRIRLGKLRQKFCKKCLNKLKGKIKIKNSHKIIVCEKCEFVNKFILS